MTPPAVSEEPAPAPAPAVEAEAAAPPSPEPVSLPVDTQALDEINPDKKAKRQGIAEGGEDALKKSLLKEAGIDEDKLESTLKRVEASKKAEEAGLTIDFDLDKIKNSSAAELEEEASSLEDTAEAVATGELSVEDAQDQASGTSLLTELKRQYPQFTEILDNYKAHAQLIDDLLKNPTISNRKLDVFKSGVLKIYTNQENQTFFNEKISDKAGDAFLLLLLDDPAYFEKFLPALKKQPSLPPVLFSELKKLGLSAEELSSILTDVGEGPGAVTPKEGPPSLNLNQEAGMLHLLDDHDISPNSFDQSLFVSSSQLSASVFFDEAIDAYEALSNMGSTSSVSPDDEQIYDNFEQIGKFTNEDVSSVSSGSSEGDDTYVYGGRNITMAGGSYTLQHTESSIAASDKLSLLGDIVFSGSSSSELIFLSAGSIDTSNLSSVTHPGTLGFGSFDSLTIEKFVSKQTNFICVLDSLILKNSTLVTNSTGSDFIHLMAVSEINAQNSPSNS